MSRWGRGRGRVAGPITRRSGVARGRATAPPDHLACTSACRTPGTRRSRSWRWSIRCALRLMPCGGGEVEGGSGRGGRAGSGLRRPRRIWGERRIVDLRDDGGRGGGEGVLVGGEGLWLAGGEGWRGEVEGGGGRDPRVRGARPDGGEYPRRATPSCPARRRRWTRRGARVHLLERRATRP